MEIYRTLLFMCRKRSLIQYFSGFIRDNLTGYDNIFLLAGAGIMISGLMVVAIDIFMLTCDTDHEKKHLMKRDR